MRFMHFVLPAALAVGATAAFAQSDDTRFSMEKTANGYVRMDKRTGEMSICTEQSGQLVCKLAADERSAFEGEVDRMQASIEALEKRVTQLETDKQSYLPSDEQVDRSMDTMQKFFRSFMDMVKEFDKELGDEPKPGEQRT